MTDRSYNQFCGLARALDLVGERWALLVVRELVLGPKRFTDLQTGLPGIGTNVLATRLKELERDGVVRRRTLPPPAGSTVYELTEYGRELEPVLLAFGRWGARTLGTKAADQTLRSSWIGVALRAFADGEATAGIRAAVELRLDQGTLHARLDDGQVVVVEGPCEAPDLVIETANEPLIALLARAATPEQLAGAGVLRLAGDERLAGLLPEVFPFAPPENETPTAAAEEPAAGSRAVAC